jgi:hypothetical protein
MIVEVGSEEEEEEDHAIPEQERGNASLPCRHVNKSEFKHCRVSSKRLDMMTGHCIHFLMVICIRLVLSHLIYSIPVKVKIGSCGYQILNFMKKCTIFQYRKRGIHPM